MYVNVESWRRGTSPTSTQILEAAEHQDGVCVHRQAEKYIVKKDQVLLLAEVTKYHHIHKVTKEIVWRKF